MEIKDLNDKINSHVISAVKFNKMVRFVAGENLADCKSVNVDMIEPIRGRMKGNDEDLTIRVLLDALSLATSMEESELEVCMPNSVMLANTVPHKSCTLVSVEKVLENFHLDFQYEGKITKAGAEGKEPDYEKIEKEAEEKRKEEIAKAIEAEKKEAEAKEEEKKDPTEEAISNYYAQYCNGVIQELLKRYSAMFSSGYELERPAGILARDGIVRVSGSSRKVKESSVSEIKMYELFCSRLNFREVSTRSIKGIADSIYEGYISNRNTLLYFPNKMLEFAFGLCAPTGDNQESLNTYTAHADSRKWVSYRNGELTKAVKKLVKRSAVCFVLKTMGEDKNYRSNEVMNGLSDFLIYLQGCLSLCILVPEYKTGIINGEKEIASFKIRVCDPQASILNVDLTPTILTTAFMGGVGKEPFSYMPSVQPEVFVVEYAHEFNHAMSQATPLFAYKALESIQKQTENGELGLSFNNLILGKAANGSILRGGTHGVDLTKHLTHVITAGSQAGKGVMTLNILASGIASRKNIIYLDRKPDMASLFKYLAPNMPVINGGDIQQGYDAFNQWQNVSLGNVPDEVCEAFDLNPTWSELGDLVYMRLLKLAIALLMVRGSGHIEGCFGGESGLLIVVDEFSNFQRNYMSMISTLTSCLPPITIDKARKAVEDKKMTDAEFNRVYNNAGYYALSYLNSMMEDIKYLKVKKDAGYDPLETARSDVFVIGQTLERGMFDYEEFKETFSKSSASGRYKSVDAKGITKGSFAVGEQSIPYNLVNFKTADAFFGRNRDDGRDKYLAQTNKGSKANGRLDDKASNFAYLNSFSENTRKKIVHGSEAENISIANRCVYFKPFLILNSSGMGDECVKKMFDRVQKNAGVSPEELITENPSYNNPSVINEAVGFIDYINMAGVSDVKGILEQSSSVLNHIVQNVLKYPGDWYQFVTDLSPEWLFTIKDVVDAVETGNCSLYNPSTNPILAEYVDFNPQRFGGSYEDSTKKSLKAAEDFFFDNDKTEDFSNEKEMDKKADERLADALGDNDKLNPDEELSFDSLYEPIKDGAVQETGKGEGASALTEEDEDVKKILDLLQQLKALGVDVEIGDEPIGTESQIYQQSETSSFGEEFERMDYEDDIVSLDMLMQIVTNDVIKKFGGLDRITSLKVIGGNLIVNGYYYRCKIKDLYAKNIPYDIRRDINSGNVSKLFNYGCIASMHHIRDLEFDSLNFTYDYVSSALGFGTRISVDRFFEQFRSLQVLTIGKRRFDRQNYISQANGEDIFYRPKRRTILADASEMYLGKWHSKSWELTKNIAKKKNCKKVWKVVGVAGMGTVAATTGLAKVGTKATRGLIRNVKVLGNGIKDLFNT